MEDRIETLLRQILDGMRLQMEWQLCALEMTPKAPERATHLAQETRRWLGQTEPPKPQGA
jgi:hypothetical protein